MPLCRIDGDAVGVAGHLVPGAPAVDGVAALRERVDRRRGKRLSMCSVSRASPSAKRPDRKRGSLDRLLDVEAVVDHRRIELQLDLRLAVGAHAAEHAPELAVAVGDRGDQRVQRHLAGLEPIGMVADRARNRRRGSAARRRCFPPPRRIRRRHRGSGSARPRCRRDRPRRYRPCRRTGCRRTAPCPMATRAPESISRPRSSA